MSAAGPQIADEKNDAGGEKMTRADKRRRV
jgi:hypothetical protein